MTTLSTAVEYQINVSKQVKRGLLDGELEVHLLPEALVPDSLIRSRTRYMPFASSAKSAEVLGAFFTSI